MIFHLSSIKHHIKFTVFNFRNNLKFYSIKTMINALKDIPELTANHVHIKNEREVIDKINVLINEGNSNLQIVSDYDLTLTKQHENGKRHHSSFGMIQLCPSMPPDYGNKNRELMEKYRPIEVNPFISHEEKVKSMNEWWSRAEDILKGIKLPLYEFDEIAELYNPSLRDGTAEMLKDLSDVNVPVLVFSAGLGDCVEAVLKYKKVLYPNVKIISNYLDFDENSIIKGFKNKMITVLNKNEQILEGTEYYNLVKNRGNVIVLGDHLGDAQMANGVPHRNTSLKIGFLYDHMEESLPAYKDTFDIVLADDQTMNVLRAILKLIIKQ